MTPITENHRIHGEWFAFTPGGRGPYHDAIPAALSLAGITPTRADGWLVSLDSRGCGPCIRICEPSDPCIEVGPCFAIAGLTSDADDGRSETIEYHETTDPTAMVRIVESLIERLAR